MVVILVGGMSFSLHTYQLASLLESLQNQPGGSFLICIYSNFRKNNFNPGEAVTSQVEHLWHLCLSLVRQRREAPPMTPTPLLSKGQLAGIRLTTLPDWIRKYALKFIPASAWQAKALIGDANNWSVDNYWNVRSSVSIRGVERVLVVPT